MAKLLKVCDYKDLLNIFNNYYVSKVFLVHYLKSYKYIRVNAYSTQEDKNYNLICAIIMSVVS